MARPRLKYMRQVNTFDSKFSHYKLTSRLEYPDLIATRLWIRKGNFVLLCENASDKGTVINYDNINELDNIYKGPEK